MKSILIFFVLLLVNCNTMSENDSNFTISPTQIDTDDYSLIPVLTVEEEKKLLKLNLSIARSSKQLPLFSKDFNIGIVDVKGGELKVHSKTKGQLTEVGGSLGVTANIEYVFTLNEKKLKKLTVLYNDEEHVFDLN